MKLRYRLLCLSSILFLFLLGFINYFMWFPPTTRAYFYLVGVKEVIQNQDLYEGHTIIIQDTPYNITSDVVFFKSSKGFIKINCSFIDVSDVTNQFPVYFLGTCRLESEGQVIALDHHVLISFSLQFSLIGLAFVFIILFLALKFRGKDFSWELRRKSPNA